MQDKLTSACPSSPRLLIKYENSLLLSIPLYPVLPILLFQKTFLSISSYMVKIWVNFELETGAVGQTTDFKESNKRLEWSLKKIVGGSECTLRAKLTFSQESHGNITKEAGPVSMTFTIPMYNPSRLQVKYLQIAKTSKSYNPYRWVRYVTQTNSYVARI
nr:AP-4 complex subunit mu [Ipomoea batatas]